MSSAYVNSSHLLRINRYKVLPMYYLIQYHCDIGIILKKKNRLERLWSQLLNGRTRTWTRSSVSISPRLFLLYHSCSYQKGTLCCTVILNYAKQLCIVCFLSQCFNTCNLKTRCVYIRTCKYTCHKNIHHTCLHHRKYFQWMKHKMIPNDTTLNLVLSVPVVLAFVTPRPHQFKLAFHSTAFIPSKGGC